MSKKIKGDLAVYKRSNKVRRVQLLNNWGYASETAFFKAMKHTPKTTKSSVKTSVTKTSVTKSSKTVTKTVTSKKAVKKTIHNVFIMDDSGSMSGAKYNNGVEGIQKLVQSIKSDKLSNNTISIVDLNRGEVYWMAKPLSVNYKPHRNLGGTPLYLTIGETIKNLLKDVPKGEHVLLNITTDGQDTHGFGEYSNLPNTLKEVQDKNNFTVTFVGTKSDVEYIKRTLNVEASNTLVHDNTGEGLKKSFETTLSARTVYSSNVSRGMSVKSNFYKKVGTL